MVVEYAPYGNLKDYLREQRIKMAVAPVDPLNSHYSSPPEMLQQHKSALTFVDLVNFSYQVRKSNHHHPKRNLQLTNIKLGCPRHGVSCFETLCTSRSCRT